jgi:two-component system chemotaxis response regulator CheY
MNLYLIDNDLISRMALVDVVESMTVGQNFKLTEFDSADEAWAALSSASIPPDLVLCDIGTPSKSGLDLLQRLSELPSRIPCVLISSSSDTDTIKRAASLGAAGYIVKPFAHEEVVPRLTKYFDAAQAKVAESPADTMRRLKITQDRYMTYLSGLSAQFKQLVSEVRISDEAQAEAKVRSKIDSLISGCTTLGLWKTAQVLQKVKTAKLEALQDLFAQVTQQLHQHTMLASELQSWSVPVVKPKQPAGRR